MENLGKLKHGHFLMQYEYCRHETRTHSTLWQGLSDHVSSSDLHPKSYSHSSIKNLGEKTMAVFSQSMSTTVMKLGTIVLCSKAYQIIPV